MTESSSLLVRYIGSKNMWIADKWTDYEIIDTSCGEKLERWGKFYLLRPDPQVIWKTEKVAPEWKQLNGHYHRSAKGGGEWEFFDLPKEWEISYGGLHFKLSPFSFKHTGLFPEQAVNWDWFSSLIRSARDIDPSREIKVLNLFAYTGGATAAAAKAGASLVHVDASKGMTNAARENLQLSGLENAPCRYIVDDCMKLVEREIRRGNRYDAVIMDPPSYGRGPKGELWKLEDMADSLIRTTVKLLSDEPLFFLVNSYTTGLSPAVMQYLLMTALPENLRAKAETEVGETCLPVTETGLPHPSGASVRVTFR